MTSKDKKLEEILSDLRSSSLIVRAAAIEALGRHGGPKAVEYLLKHYGSSSVWERYAVTKALGSIGGRRATGILVQNLNDFYAVVRWAAVKALEKTKKHITNNHISEITYKLERCEKSERYSVRDKRHQYVSALGISGKKKAVSQLMKRLYAEDELIRGRAALGVGRLGKFLTPRQLQSLTDGLKDEKQEKRIYPAIALGEMGDPRVLELLIEKIHQSGVDSGCAAEALGKLKEYVTDEQVRGFIEGLKDHRRNSCARALGQLGRREAIPLLIDAMEDGDTVCVGPVVALAELKEHITEEQFQIVVSGLKDETDERRAASAWLLELLSRKEALEPLIPALADDDGIVRDCARKAVNSILVEHWYQLNLTEPGKLREKIYNTLNRMEGLQIELFGNEEHPKDTLLHLFQITAARCDKLSSSAARELETPKLPPKFRKKRRPKTWRLGNKQVAFRA